MSAARTLDELRRDFGRSRFLALPIAGTVAGVLGAVLTEGGASIALFVCMGAIFPLGLLFARLSGEDLLGTASENELDTSPGGSRSRSGWSSPPRSP
jgi:hypothetical protein